MSILPLNGRTTFLAIGFATALLAADPAGAGASNRSGPDGPAWMGHSEQTPNEDEAAPRGSRNSSQTSSASAWSQSDGDHGITVTTTRNGDSTSCMVVEWKREGGGIKKWQYRCDTGRP